MKVEEIKAEQGLLMAAILEAKAEFAEVEKQIDPLLQRKYKLQEVLANLRLEYSKLEWRRAMLEKPSPETEKLAAALMKQHSLSRRFALEVVARLAILRR